MNDEITALLFDAIAKVQQHIRSGEYLALLMIEGDRKLVLSDYDYLQDRTAAVAFERRAAAHARQVAVVRWVLAVPQVWVINERDVAIRAVSHHQLRPGEQEAITWMSYDRTDGIDYGRVPFARRPNGEPVFDEPEVFTVPLASGEHMPGNTLLHSLLDDDQIG